MAATWSRPPFAWSTPMSVTTVWASRGKVVRAEPVAALYEQDAFIMSALFRRSKIRCAGSPAILTGHRGFSPDRVDALVWALTDLLVEPMAHSGIFELYREQARQQAAANVSPHRSRCMRRAA